MARILGINGGMRPDGPADHALRLMIRILTDEGAQCETFGIGGLPLWDGRPDDTYPASVAAWRAACDAADGLVVVTTSFRGGMPGALKNALDLVDTTEVGGKPFALVGIAVGDAEPGLTDTTRVLRHLGGVAAVPDVVISRAREHWGAAETPANAAVGIAMQKVAGDLVRVCQLREAGTLPSPLT